MAIKFLFLCLFFKQLRIHDIARAATVDYISVDIKLVYYSYDHQGKYFVKSSYHLFKVLEPQHKLIRGFYRCTPIVLWTTNISVIFLLMIPLEGRLPRGAPPVMTSIYTDTSFLLAFLSQPLVSTSTTFEGDLPLGDSPVPLFPPFTYSYSRPLLINLLISSFNWMQCSLLWTCPLWKWWHFKLSVQDDTLMGKKGLISHFQDFVLAKSWQIFFCDEFSDIYLSYWPCIPWSSSSFWRWDSFPARRLKFVLVEAGLSNSVFNFYSRIM